MKHKKYSWETKKCDVKPLWQADGRRHQQVWRAIETLQNVRGEFVPILNGYWLTHPTGLYARQGEVYKVR